MAWARDISLHKQVRRDFGLDIPTPVVERMEEQLAADTPSDIDVELQQAAFDVEQIKQACRIDLDFLAALVMPEVYKYKFSPMHRTAWQLLTEGVLSREDKFPQFALGIPRGHAKTTLIKLFILWCILFTDRRFFLVTCATEGHAINILSDVCSMMRNANTVAVFGDYRVGMDTDTKSLKKFAFCGREITMFAVGAEGAVRGANVNNERPDVIIMDDIQTKENSDSELLSTKLEDWMVGTLMKSKSQSRCIFVFAGNMFPSPNSILKKLKKNQTWTKFISGAILADGKALWPEHKSISDLLKELDNDIAMGKAHIFFAEVLNDTEVGVNSNVDYSKFPQWKWTKHDIPQGKFIIIDPSQGKGKDHDVIVCCEVYDECIAVREIIEEHYSPKNLILKALITALTKGIYCITIESMAYQSTLIFWFEEVCKEYGIQGISFLPIYTNSTSKNSRIMKIVQAMQVEKGEIYLHPDVKPLVQRQIADWNPMKRDNRDDILDAVSNAPLVLSTYQFEIMTPTSVAVIETSSARVVEDNHAF